MEAIETIRAAVASAAGGDDPFVLNDSTITISFAVTAEGTISIGVNGSLSDELTHTLVVSLVPAQGVSFCLRYAGHGRHCEPAADPHCGPPPTDPPAAADPPADRLHPAGPRPPTPQALEMLRHAIIGTAVNLVSGPGGLASFLRTGQLGARLAGPSLPLDVGHSAEIPAAIRRGAGHWAAARRQRALAAWASAAGSGLAAWGLGTEAARTITSLSALSGWRILLGIGAGAIWDMVLYLVPLSEGWLSCRSPRARRAKGSSR